MFDRLRPCVPFFGLVVWSAMLGLAQAPVGSLTGAVMPGVAVTITNKDTGLERQIATSAEGIFSAGTPAYAYASQTGYNGLADNRNYFASWGPPAARQTLSGSLVVEFQSAPPFEPYLSVNQNYAGKLTPLGQVIPTITLPASFSFPHSFNSQDLRVTKDFRICERMRVSIFGEVFNIFHIANLTNYNAALNAPEFGQATQRTPNIFGTGGPRAFQLGRILF